LTARIGIIGCGHIAKFHARNIRDAIARHGIPATYHAACDHDPERARTFADIGGCALATTRAADVIDSCDIVYVCTETAGHPPLVATAAAAGRHVFCEKPLGRSLAEAIAAEAAVGASGRTHQVGLVLRVSPVYRVLEDLMQGDHGLLLAVHLRDDQVLPVGGIYGSEWRADVARAGGGVLIEHSIHDADLLARLAGPVTSVQCRLLPSRYPGIEAVAQVTLVHTGGHTSTLTSVWHAIGTRQSTRSIEVFFERARFTSHNDYFGAITAELGDAPAVTIGHDEVLERFMTLEHLDRTVEDLRSLAGLGDRRFLEAALAGRPAHPDFTTAIEAHRIVEACYESDTHSGAPTAVGPVYR
jgi:predicted dehydrogenase